MAVWFELWSAALVQAASDERPTIILFAESVAAAERAACAELAERNAAWYPEAVFPPDSATPNALTAKGGRLASRSIAAAIRTRGRGR
jgi:hypothetical protein